MGDARRIALILGGARYAWYEVLCLEALIGQRWPGLVIATNDAGAWWPRRLDCWVTFHEAKLHEVRPPGRGGDWLEERRERGFPPAEEVVVRGDERLVGVVKESWAGGSSTLLGVVVAEKVLRCDGAVLCGSPMMSTPHFHGGHAFQPWADAEKHWEAWGPHVERLRGFLRSMAVVTDEETGGLRPGRTREVFGAPTVGWLRAG